MAAAAVFPGPSIQAVYEYYLETVEIALGRRERLDLRVTALAKTGNSTPVDCLSRRPDTTVETTGSARICRRDGTKPLKLSEVRGHQGNHRVHN